MGITKQIKDAVMDVVMMRIDHANYGMLSGYRMPYASANVLERNKIRITSRLCTTDEVVQDGNVIAKITYRYATRKVNGMYKMLKPQIAYV